MISIIDFILEYGYNVHSKKRIKIRLMIYWIVLVISFGYIYTGPRKDYLVESLGAAIFWPVFLPLKTSAMIFEYVRGMKLPSLEWSK